MVGRLDLLSHPLRRLLLPLFRKLGVGWPTANILSAESSPVISIAC
jgi:hypothetical protein